MKQLKLENLPVVALRTLDQVGIVVRDVEAAVRAFESILGIGPFWIIDWPIPGIDPEATYYGKPGRWRMREAFAQIGQIQLELIQPLDGHSVFQDFLETHGPGLHHIRLLTDDFEGDTAALQKAGIAMISSGTGVHIGSQWAYFDTREILEGVLIELRKRLNESQGANKYPSTESDSSMLSGATSS